MDIIQIILQIGGAATAITAICLLIKHVVKLFKSAYTFLHNLEVKVNKLDKHDDAQYKAILRLIITADHVPVSERLIAGKEYVEELHGNGEVKAIYLKLKEDCERATRGE